ncbi:MAG: hypothetical protein JNK18_10540 [Cyclobacteriaceae bacterium]|nr:hypothetical protein [Cyclobacteriaceae bacterium]
MKRLVLVIFLIASVQSAFAYISGIAIQTEKNSTFQVYINGQLRTAQPKSFVRIKSKPGLYHVMVKVLNPNDKEWYVLRKDVRVTKGYEFYYKVDFSKGKRPVLQLVRRYPVYSHYFLNPGLYNKHPVS